jgi:hypothetical protein
MKLHTAALLGIAVRNYSTSDSCSGEAEERIRKLKSQHGTQTRRDNGDDIALRTLTLLLHLGRRTYSTFLRPGCKNCAIQGTAERRVEQGYAN